MIFDLRAGGRGSGLFRAAEEILQQYPSLPLSEIYATTSYYLRHRDSADEYLRERQLERDQVRRRNESLSDPAGLRERLLKRNPKS